MRPSASSALASAASALASAAFALASAGCIGGHDGSWDSVGKGDGSFILIWPMNLCPRLLWLPP